MALVSGRENPTPSVTNKLIFLFFLVVILFLTSFSCDEPKDKATVQKETTQETKQKAIVQKTNIQKKAKTKKRSIHFLSEKERILYRKVRKIPASQVEENRDGYNELLELNPSNTFYKKKFKYYSKLAYNKEVKREKRKHDEEIQRRNRSQAEAIINQLEDSDAISIDNSSFRIYVNPMFWETMSYQNKIAFCTILQTVYPRYSILDEYSGKKLADRNLFGDTRVLQR